MAGQGVPLAGFQEGDYRLAIKVTDLSSGRSISREVMFTVRPRGGLGRPAWTYERRALEEAMERQPRIFSAAFVGAAVLTVAAWPLEAQGPRIAATGMQARVMSGSVSGTVTDEGGAALPGAMVSAMGVTLASAVTDQHGRFAFGQLPQGEYLIRAHMSGFVASGGTRVRVGGSPTTHRFELRRAETAVATAGTTAAPVRTRPIIAAGFDLPRGPEAESEAETASKHPHEETAWRLRHIKRSILKDVGAAVVLAERPAGDRPNGSLFGRAMGSAANLATSLFTDFPFSGEVNFLTTGAFAPGAVLSGDGIAARRRLSGARRADAGRRLVDPGGDERRGSVVVDRRRARSRRSRGPASTPTTSGCPTAPRNTWAATRRRWPR